VNKRPVAKILYGNGFPSGGAATKRCLHIAKGFAENGFDVEVLIFRPTERPNRIENRLPEGTFEGVRFKYVTKSMIWPPGLLGRIVKYYSGLLRLRSYLKKIHKTKPLDLLVSANYYGYLSARSATGFCRKRGIPSVIFQDEYPGFILNSSVKFRALNRRIILGLMRKFTIIAVISDELFNFWNNALHGRHLKEEVATLRAELPEISDEELLSGCPHGEEKNAPALFNSAPSPQGLNPQGFSGETHPFYESAKNIVKVGLTAALPDGILLSKKYDFGYFFFTGFTKMRFFSEDIRKDEPEVLIQAFTLVLKRHPEIKLVIGGDRDEELVEYCAQMGISDSVLFAGKLPENEYFSAIRYSLAAVLPRPDTLQTKASVPYRLGDYLIAGAKVISSDVGEIKKIAGSLESRATQLPETDKKAAVKRGENTYSETSELPGNVEMISFYQPGNAEDLSEKMCRVIEEREQPGDAVSWENLSSIDGEPTPGNRSFSEGGLSDAKASATNYLQWAFEPKSALIPLVSRLAEYLSLKKN